MNDTLQVSGAVANCYRTYASGKVLHLYLNILVCVMDVFVYASALNDPRLVTIVPLLLTYSK